MAARPKLFLLDSMALIYRAHFAFINNPRITSTGVNTSALYGFTTTLFEVINKQKPSHLAVCTDISGKTFRHDDFAEYKAGRQETPEDILAAIPQVQTLCETMHIPYLGYENWEADDIIGTIAKKAQDEGFDVYMMTPDKDFAQLVDDHIYHYKPSRPPKPAEVYDLEKTLKKWEIKHPHQVIDILGLMGDKVDNIPGIPGVGEKTAIKLIRQYGSIENMLEHSHELKGKLKERVEAHRDEAILSKKLATINVECPVAYKSDDFELNDYLNEELKTFFAQFEFRTLGQRLFGKEFSANAAPTVQSNSQMDLFSQGAEETTEDSQVGDSIASFDESKVKYTLVDSDKALNKLVELLEKSIEFAFDTETTGLDPLLCDLVGMSFSVKPGEAFYVPVNEDDPNWEKWVKPFEGILQNPQKLLIGQNVKYDLQVMHRKGIEIECPLYDTMLAHYLIDPDGRHGMDHLAETLLQYSPIPIEALIGKKGKQQGNMKDLKPQEVVNYACEDADITLQLKHRLSPEAQERNAEKLLQEVECPLIYVLSDMEMEGVKVDKAFLDKYSKELNIEIAQHQEKVFELAGETFNLNSPKQLGDVLFGKLDLDPKAKKTKTGQFKTDEQTLQKLSKDHDIVQYILDYRQLSKLKSTYVDALPKLINPNTGRVHTTFQQAVAATGRLSSYEPNLQNIPIRTEKGRETRKAFVSRGEGYTILSADYSQVELRLVASISEDEAMLEAFNQGMDIHTATAARVFDVKPEEVSREQRSQAKAVNFGIIYGQGAFGLAQTLGIKRTEAKEIIDQYFARYAGLKGYMDSVVDVAKKNGYVETLLGRRRYLRDINSANHTLRSFAERNAINAPIQGSAADLIKLAMINIHKELKQRKFKSKMILQVHDELLFDAWHEEREELLEMVKKQMAEAMSLKVPLVVDANFGNNWLEAH